MKLLFLALAFLIAAPVSSYAGPCPPAPPTHRPPRHPRPKPPAAKPPEATPAPCACPPGKPGRDGHDGKTIVVVYREPSARRLAIRIGVMGAVHAPHGDWAWGPALQLAQPVGRHGEFVIDAGLALPADGWIANERGLLLHAGYARYRDANDFGLTLGVHSIQIAGSSSNGNTSGGYLGVDAGVVLRSSRFRAELGPVLSGLRDSHESGTQFAFGFAGSLFVSF